MGLVGQKLPLTEPRNRAIERPLSGLLTRMKISAPATGVGGEAARQTFCAEIQDCCFEGQFRKNDS